MNVTASVINRRTFWPRLNAVLLVLIILGTVGYWLIDYATRQWAVVASGSNLRSIGSSLQMYASANAGRLPQDWAELFLAKEVELTPEAFVSPFSPYDTTRRNWPKAARGRLLATSGAFECTYIYAAAGLLAGELPKDAVLAIEQAEAHSGKYANVLMADCSVETLHVGARPADRLIYDRIVLDFANGVRPVRWPNSATTQMSPP